MTLGLAFYIILLLWFIGGAWTRWGQGPTVYGPDILMFICVILLGWKVFGAPIHG